MDTELQQVGMEAPTLRTQRELFGELAAARQIADLALQAVENKIQEIAEELGATFKNEGYCPEHPDAPVLQIRVRMRKSLGRKVPFFVPLKGEPREWLGKAARDAKAVRDYKAQETGSALLQITEPTVTADPEGTQVTTSTFTRAADDGSGILG